MQPPRTTVVLTSYNHAKYLREAIESVLRQSYPDFELVIWDDGSTDESWQIIQSYSDSRIRAVRNETGKSGWGTRKAILEARSGEYVAIHHSDDIWQPEKLERQVAFLDKNPRVGAVFSNALIIGERGEPFEDESHFYYSIFNQPNRTRHEWLNFFFYRGNALCHPSVLLRKSCLDDCGGYRYGFYQVGDLDLWVRLCLKYDIHILSEKLVRFRVRENEMNVSGNYPDARIRLQFEMLQIFDNYRKLQTAEELVGVFPTASQYIRPAGFDSEFVLAMVALEAPTWNLAKLFGLGRLFELLNDPARAKAVDEVYHFNHTDFVALSAKHDVFAIETVSDLRATVAARDHELTDVRATVAARDHELTDVRATLAGRNQELVEIRTSKVWKFGLLLRRLRVLLAPPNSRRAKALAPLARIVTQLLR